MTNDKFVSLNPCHNPVHNPFDDEFRVVRSLTSTMRVSGKELLEIQAKKTTRFHTCNLNLQMAGPDFLE
jgi:hypothetical protein